MVRKGALEKSTAFPYRNRYTLIREDAIRTVLSYTGKSPVVSTTGKISREVYEIRDARGEGPILIEVCCALHSREDLGRPKSSPLENKKAFMQSLKD